MGGELTESVGAQHSVGDVRLAYDFDGISKGASGIESPSTNAVAHLTANCKAHSAGKGAQIA